VQDGFLFGYIFFRCTGILAVPGTGTDRVLGDLLQDLAESAFGLRLSASDRQTWTGKPGKPGLPSQYRERFAGERLRMKAHFGQRLDFADGKQ
jgi:hypothetical protein